MRHLTSEEHEFIKNLYMQYSDDLYNIAIRLTHKDDIARECVQETFLTASLKVSLLYKHPNQQAWLYKTLHLKLRELTRPKKKKINGLPVKIELLDIFDCSVFNLINRLSSYDSYFENVENAEFISSLENILTPQEVEYIKCKYIEEMPTKEIAVKLGISYTAATTAGARIRKKLKKFYKNRDKSATIDH